MDLLTPGIGLMFWQTIVFLSVFAILLIFVWKPVAEALRTREGYISDSLNAAEKAKEKVKQLKEDNEYLLEEARIERDKMIQDAIKVSKQLKEDAKAATEKETKRMIEEARRVIEAEKKDAMVDVKNLVAELSLNIAEKVLRRNLKSDNAQQELVKDFIKDLNVN